MPSEQALALFKEASNRTIERLRADRGAVSDRIRPVLLYLEDHLFDRSVDAEQVKNACGIRDNNFTTLFSRELRLPLGGYIREHRMATAAWLLRETTLPVHEIGSLLGYPEPRHFGETFKRWGEVTPTQYRRKTSEKRQLLSLPAVGGSEGPTLRDALKERREIFARALDGGLTEAQASVLVSELLARYPTTAKLALIHLESGTKQAEEGAQASKEGYPPEIDPLDQLRAEQLWTKVQKLPRPEQTKVIRHAGRLKTPALFALLQREYLEGGRENRQRGVEIAELALESVRALAAESDYDHETLSLLEAEAWMCIANAKRLVLDFKGSEAAFRAAENRLTEGSAAGVRAEFLDLMAALRWYQRRLKEALDLENQAINTLPANSDPQTLVRYLAQRAVLYSSLENHSAALVDNEEALQLLGQSASYLKLVVVYNTAICLLDLNKTDETESHLEEARRLGEFLGQSAAMCSIVYLEGRLLGCRGNMAACLEKWNEARAGYFEFKLTGDAALISLEIAIALADQEKNFEARMLASEIIPILDNLGESHPRMRAAGLQLRKRLKEKALNRDELANLLDTLKQLRKIPSVVIA